MQSLCARTKLKRTQRVELTSIVAIQFEFASKPYAIFFNFAEHQHVKDLSSIASGARFWRKLCPDDGWSNVDVTIFPTGRWGTIRLHVHGRTLVHLHGSDAFRADLGGSVRTNRNAHDLRLQCRRHLRARRDRLLQHGSGRYALLWR